MRLSDVLPLKQVRLWIRVVEAMSELQEKNFISITYFDKEQFECNILQA